MSPATLACRRCHDTDIPWRLHLLGLTVVAWLIWLIWPIWPIWPICRSDRRCLDDRQPRLENAADAAAEAHAEEAA
ncbi:MAG: hypothetical protein GVY16_03985 [Planctomycetes bacterium]|jgi:hypothetical protein|nr:hypothetical protein [Planctomycetota bacterium]